MLIAQKVLNLQVFSLVYKSLVLQCFNSVDQVTGSTASPVPKSLLLK